MTTRVCKFFNLLGKHTRFDRGSEEFHNYLKTHLERKHATYPRFVSEIKEIWEQYIKGQVGMNISRFFMEKGQEFMQSWYCEVFPFPKTRINFEFRPGGSQVDVLITVKYVLSDVELTCLAEIIQKYNIPDKPVTGAALIALLEPCVLFGMVLSSIVGQEIRVSIEDRMIEQNHLTLELSARPR